jgi:putative mRNA 3-end processing factor
LVKITFLGACKEIGRSGVLLESETSSDRILLDFGIKMEGKDDNFPDHVSGKDLTAIIITHSHIDHVGGIPIFFISGNVPVYMTELTLDVSELLLKDMMNISDFYLPFERSEIFKLRNQTRFVNFRQRTKIGVSTFMTLYNAGHIPGSAMVLVEMDDKTILYTGDINFIPTQLMAPASIPLEELDILIMESTYGMTNHEPRESVEKKFVENVTRVIKNKGQVLIPAFGVSRSQEIMMVFNKYNVDFPVFVDGLARRIARIYESYNRGSFFRSFQELTTAFSNSHFVIQKHRFHEREDAKACNGAIVAPSGMLKGGTARMYAESIIRDPNSAIYLVSFQIPESPGAILLKENKYVVNKENTEQKFDVQCEVQFFDFSSHAGQSELIEFVEKCKFKNSNKLVYLVHGDGINTTGLAKELQTKGINAIVAEKSNSVKL